MRLLRDANGTVMVEYGLVLALLSFAFMSGMFFIEKTTSTSLKYTQDELQNYGLRNGL